MSGVFTRVAMMSGVLHTRGDDVRGFYTRGTAIRGYTPVAMMSVVFTATSSSSSLFFIAFAAW